MGVMVVMNMTIGERIKTIRKEKGLSQQALAKKTGLAKITISDYEAGKYVPRKENIIKIASALEVPPHQIGGSSLWNDLINLDSLQKESKMFDLIFTLYGDSVAETIHNFLSLTDEGQQKASEYIDLLMQKHKKE